MTTAGTRTIGGAGQLARGMVGPARALREAAASALRSQSPPALLGEARRFLCEAVSPEFGRRERDEDFADAFAQLVAFGLFVAGADNALGPSGGGVLTPQPVPYSIGMFAAAARSLPGGADALGQLARLLAQADWAAVAEGVRRHWYACDPSPHFYELFLACYDSTVRRARGVYYTPASVVSYLVRSVDCILRTEFGLPDGLADAGGGSALRIVDPACGAGAFLAGVVDHVRRSFSKRCEPSVWRDHVQQRLRRRLVGFEVLPGSCAAAHFLLRRQLGLDDPTGGSGQPSGAFAGARDDRLGIHLANPLVEDERRQSAWLGMQGERPILAILGNPPYSNFGRQNRSVWIRHLLADYKEGLGEKKLNLDDDFIKFIRWAQYWIDQAGAGVLALITSNTYLTGLTHRQMRRSLGDSFSDMYLLDLHGGAARKENSPPGVQDENIFGIQTPVAIGVFVRRPVKGGPARVFHADLWGSRAHKHEALAGADISTTRWTVAPHPSQPHFFFAPRATAAEQELRRFPRIDQVFGRYTSGVQTKRDALLVAFTRREAAERMQAFFRAVHESGEPRAAACSEADRRLARKAAGLAYSESHLQRYLVAPFDLRWVYYDPRLLGRARYSVLRHVVAGSPALVFMRQSTNGGQYDHFLAARALASDRVFYSAHGAPFLAPLYLHNQQQWTPNLRQDAVSEFARRLKLRFRPDGPGDPDTAFHAGDLFHYMYALFHSPTYRSRYREALQIDFPRVPITSDRGLFRRMCQWGGQLAALHTFAPPTGSPQAPTFPVSGDNIVAHGYPKYAPPAVPGGRRPADGQGDLEPGRVHINGEQYFEGVEQDVWDFQIGGYRVLSKWLKDRRGRRLERADLDHAARMIVVLSETTRLMREIDSALPKWPW